MSFKVTVEATVFVPPVNVVLLTTVLTLRPRLPVAVPLKIDRLPVFRVSLAALTLPSPPVNVVVAAPISRPDELLFLNVAAVPLKVAVAVLAPTVPAM